MNKPLSVEAIKQLLSFIERPSCLDDNGNPLTDKEHFCLVCDCWAPEPEIAEYHSNTCSAYLHSRIYKTSLKQFNNHAKEFAETALFYAENMTDQNYLALQAKTEEDPGILQQEIKRLKTELSRSLEREKNLLIKECNKRE